MTYAIIKPQTNFLASEVKVRGSLLHKNKLWKINNGEKLLHFVEGESGFLREIGLETFSERVKYLDFSNEEFNRIVEHFFQKGKLLFIDYHELDEFAQEELTFLLKQVQVGSEIEEDAVSAFMEAYVDFVEEIAGKPWYITLYHEKQQVKVYPNGVMYASFRKGEECEALVLNLYKEIFALLDTPFTLSPVLISEKETTDHPLTNAHTYLTELLNLAGEAAQRQANLSKEEVEKINKLLLKYTKDFKNKRVYKS